MIPETARKCLAEEDSRFFTHIGSWLGVSLIAAVSWLPRPVRHAMGRGLGSLAYRYNRKRRRIVEINLALCYPDWSQEQRDRVAKQHFQAMGRSFMDYGLFWFAPKKRLLKTVRVEGYEHAEQARAEGKKVAYHIAHCAAVEMCAVGVASRETCVGIYQPLKNRVVDCLIRHGRLRFVYKLNTRKDGLRGNIQALKAGYSVFSLTDEDMGPEQSVFVPFFEEPKATLAVTARLAVKQGAAVIPLMVYYDAAVGQYVCQMGPALEGLEGSAAAAASDARILNQGLEALIEKHPEEYMWTLRLFKTRPDGSHPYLEAK